MQILTIGIHSTKAKLLTVPILILCSGLLIGIKEFVPVLAVWGIPWTADTACLAAAFMMMESVVIPQVSLSHYCEY